MESIADLKEYFTERMKEALSLAFEEALYLKHDRLSPEHLLLGILRKGGGISGKIFQETRISLESIRKIIITLKGRGNEYVSFDYNLPTYDTLVVFNSARDWAKEFKHHYIGTEHVLLGLFSSPSTAQILKDKGLTLERVKEEVLSIVSLTETIPQHSYKTFAASDLDEAVRKFGEWKESKSDAEIQMFTIRVRYTKI